MSSGAFQSQALEQPLGEFSRPRISRIPLLILAMTITTSLLAQSKPPLASVEELKSEQSQFTQADLQPLFNQLRHDAEAYRTSQPLMFPANGKPPSPGTISIPLGRHPPPDPTRTAARDLKNVEKDIETILSVQRNPEGLLKWAKQNRLDFLKQSIHAIWKKLHPEKKKLSQRFFPDPLLEAA